MSNLQEKVKMFTPEYVLDIRRGKYSRTGAATKILQECGIGSFPVNVWEVARKMNFEVLEASFKENNVSGMMIDALEVPTRLKEFGCKRAIILNRDESKNMQSFTIAHELGHFVFDCNEETSYFDARYTKNKEKLSEEEIIQKKNEDKIDEFAAMLLMPEIMFVEYINNSPNRYDREILKKEMQSKFVNEDDLDVMLDSL